MREIGVSQGQRKSIFTCSLCSGEGNEQETSITLSVCRKSVVVPFWRESIYAWLYVNRISACATWVQLNLAANSMK